MKAQTHLESINTLSSKKLAAPRSHSFIVPSNRRPPFHAIDSIDPSELRCVFLRRERGSGDGLQLLRLRSGVQTRATGAQGNDKTAFKGSKTEIPEKHFLQSSLEKWSAGIHRRELAMWRVQDTARPGTSAGQCGSKDFAGRGDQPGKRQ